MRYSLVLALLVIAGGLLDTSRCWGGDCASCNSCSSPAPQKIIVETPPPQIIIEQSCSPIRRCGHFCICKQPQVVQMAPSYAPVAMQSVAPVAVQSFAPVAVQSVAPVAASSFSFAPMASSFATVSPFSFAPAASAAFSVSPTFAAPSAFSVGPTLGAQSFSLQAAPAPAFSMNVPFTLSMPQLAGGSQGVGAQDTRAGSAQGKTVDMRLDDALGKISTSLDALRDISDIHTAVLKEHQRRLTILEKTAEAFAAKENKDFKKSYEDAKAAFPKPKE